MYKKISFLLAVFVGAFLLGIFTPEKCMAKEQVTIDKLINFPKEYDNKQVDIEAEVIGEPMVRGDKVWINVNDGTCAVGIWTDKKVLDNIKTYGNYHNSGDKVRIKGQFHFNCKEHGGDVDIHASSFEVIEKGYGIHRDINNKRAVIALVLVSITGVLFTIYYKQQKSAQF